MIDARRMEVYTATFNSQGEILDSISAKIIDSESFDLNKEIVLIGDGAKKCSDVIPKNATIENYLSNSQGMVQLSFERYNQEEFEDVAYFEPFYLKDFIAG